MTLRGSIPSELRRSWPAFALLTLFIALPGPRRSLFSGVPFSSKAHLAAAALLIIALMLILFPPRHRVRGRWMVALALLCAAKLMIAPMLRDEGWRGQYWTAQAFEKPSPHIAPLAPVRFFFRGTHGDRIDPVLTFNDVNFALFYVNDWPDLNSYRTEPAPRHIAQPLRIRWTGYIETPSPAPLSTTVTATGTTSIAIDGAEVFRATNPVQAPLSRGMTAGIHRIDIVYDKAPGETPAFTLAPLAFAVTPAPAGSAEMRRARLAAHAIDLLGLAALLLAAGALLDAYRPITNFLLVDIWDAPDKVLLIALTTLALLAGVNAAVGARGATIPMQRSDDPLAYEASARAVLFNGMAMKLQPGDTKPYFFYPGYSYALAAAHVVFGEDYGTIRFFNWICMALTAVLSWAFLRRWLTNGSLVIFLLLLALFEYRYFAPYTHTAFTDNLYQPVCVAIVLALAVAFERTSNGWLFLGGILTAFGAATRPSMMLFPPFLIAAVLLFWKTDLLKRIGAAAAFVGGFAAGLLTFLLRNWIVARRFVLLGSMYVMLPYFLYSPGSTDIPRRYLHTHTNTATEAIGAFFHIFATDPLRFATIEVQKLLFTLGLTDAIPGCDCPRILIVIPFVFLLAAWARRIPRPVMIAIGVFALSHLTAMVVAAPWTYGYKTILPFHLLLLCGASFLLPRRGDVVVRRVPISRSVTTVRNTVSVVLPTFNERDSIRQVILDFFATGVVDEVIVVNNNAVDGTSEEVAGSGAREVLEARQGYGAATRRGLREATGDLIVICEPDGTFLPRDILKLLAYAHDFDAVYGSRTSQPLVWHGANMGFFLRLGNWAVAKYMQLIFNTPSLSDVGCTMRLLKRDVVEALADEFRIDGNQFGVEMMVLTIRHGFRVAQIPVNYMERVGASSVTGDPAKALLLGLQMIWLITKHRIREALAGRGYQIPVADDRLGIEQTPTMNS